MTQPKSIKDVETLNKLTQKYKVLKYQTEEVLPNITRLIAYTKVGGSPHPLYYDDALRVAIQETGSRILAELIEELSKHGITILD